MKIDAGDQENQLKTYNEYCIQCGKNIISSILLYMIMKQVNTVLEMKYSILYQKL